MKTKMLGYSVSLLALTLLGGVKLNAQTAAGGGGDGAGQVSLPVVLPALPGEPPSAQPQSTRLEGPQTLPLRDLSELRSWAKSQIKRGAISVWSPSMLPGGKTYADFAIDVVDESEIFTAFAQQSFDFKVAEPADGLSVYLSCQDEQGFSLFVTPDNQQHVALVNAGTRWVVPDKARYIKLKLATKLPFRFKGAQSARFILRDEKGNITSLEDLQVIGDGTVLVPSGLAGQRGELAVSGGTAPGQQPASLVYDLGTGRLRAPASGFAAFGASVKNVFTFQRDSEELRGVIHLDNGGAVFEVRYGLPQIVRIHPGFVVDNSGNVLARLPKGALRRVEPGPTEWEDFETSEETPFKVSLSPGLYHVIYDVPDNLGVHSDDEEVIVPPSYGEKG